MDEKVQKRIRRHRRIRKKIVGSKARPRLCVYCALANTHAQLIDDLDGKTLVFVSTKDKEFKKKTAYGGNVKAAKLLGQVLAERAQNKKITKVVFDRAGFLYHGRVRALAESCREHGLKF